MVTQNGRYPGIGGNREYTAGFGLLSDIGQHRSKNLAHIIYINGTSGGRAEAVQIPSGNHTVSVSKKKFLGAGEAVNTDRTFNTNRPIIL